jgi:heat shock protein HtpX
MTIYNQISENKIKTWLIMGIFIIIFSGFFYIIGKYYGSPTPYFLLGIIISLFSTFGSYFFSDKIVLFTTGAQPASKKQFFNFYTVTENLSMADGLPMPKLYIIDDPAPNAFATGRDPKHAVVCATTGLLDMMDRTELEGVIAHELSHVKNYDILLSSLVAVLVGTIALIADWIMRSFWWGGFGKQRNDDDEGGNKSPVFFLVFIIVLIITPVVATLIQLAVSRKREFLADASGALLTRYPDGLARALVKINNDPNHLEKASSSTAHLFISNPFKKGNSGSWFVNLFSTHPSIEERIKILRSM